MTSRPIATSALWQLASQLTMAALSIVTVKFVAIGLSKELAGHYNTAYGYLQLFGILADFGLYAVSVREVSRASDKAHVLGALLVLRGIILGISLFAALVIAWITPHWRGTPLPLGIAIASLVPAFTLLAGILRTIFQVEYRMHYVFIAEVTQRIITVSLTAAFIIFGIRGTDDPRVYFSFLLIGGIGAFILFLISVIYGRRLIVLRPHFDWKLINRMFKSAAPYGFAFFCTALYRQFDVTLIAQLRPDFELQNAYYGFVQRMMDMAYILPTFLLNSTLPALGSEDNAARRSLLGRTLIAVLLLGSTMALFAALWSRPLILLLTTDAYLSTATSPGSDTALGLLSVSMFTNSIIVYSFYALLAAHAWRPLVWTLSIGALFSLISNFLLIPTFGFVGASYTSLLVHTILALLLLPQALYRLPASLTTSSLLRLGAFSIILALLLALARPFTTSALATAIGGGFIGLVFIPLLALLLGLHKLFQGQKGEGAEIAPTIEL